MKMIPLIYPLWQPLPALLLLSTIAFADHSPNTRLEDTPPLSAPNQKPRSAFMQRVNEGLKPILRALEGVDSMLRSTRNFDVFHCIERFSCEMAAPLRDTEGNRPFDLESMESIAEAVNDEFVSPDSENSHDSAAAADDSHSSSSDKDKDTNKGQSDKPASDVADLQNLHPAYQYFLRPGVQQFVQPAVQQFIQPYVYPSQFFNPNGQQFGQQFGQIAPSFGSPFIFRGAQSEGSSAQPTAQSSNHQMVVAPAHMLSPSQVAFHRSPNFINAASHTSLMQFPHRAPAKLSSRTIQLIHPTHFGSRPLVNRVHHSFRNPGPHPIRRQDSDLTNIHYSDINSSTKRKRKNWLRRMLGMKRKKRSTDTGPLTEQEIKRRVRRGIFDALGSVFEGKHIVRALDRMMEGTDNSLYPYTRAALMGYTGSSQTCEKLYPNCPTTSDELIDTFNNLRSYFPNGIPFRDRIPMPFRFLLP